MQQVSFPPEWKPRSKGLRCSKNAHDGISVISTAEGAMEEITAMLQRMRELSIQVANDTNSEKDREYLQDEVNQLIREIDRISETTQFNSMNFRR